jgi:hypothetical protein
MVGNDTNEALDKSRCSHRSNARAARISSLVSTTSRQFDDRLRPNGHAAAAEPPVRSGRSPPVRSQQRVLTANLSATLRDSLVAELASLNSADGAAAWAHRRMPAKNALMSGDAQIVEEQFQAKLSAIGDGVPVDESVAPVAAVEPAVGPHRSTSEKPSHVPTKSQRSRTVRALGKTVRLRDKDHLKFVSRQACLVCGRSPSDPHHLRFTQARALGRRVSDEFTVPVCRIHHRELHRQADEVAWWDQVKINPLPVALTLWQHTRRNGGTAPAGAG